MPESVVRQPWRSGHKLRHPHAMMVIKAIKIVGLGLTLNLMVACGQKGPLTLPNAPAGAASAASAPSR